VVADGLLAEVEAFGDLGIGLVASDKVQYLALTIG